MDNRLSRIRSTIENQEVDAFLISSVPNIIYISEYNGFSPVEREAYLLITTSKAYLIVSPLHFEEVKNLAKNVEILERTSTHPLKAILKDLAIQHNIKVCGFESDSITYAEYDAFSSSFNDFIPIDISDLRLIKSSSEIDSIKKACELGDKAYSYIIKHITTGITEKEIALKLEWFIRTAGHDISFPPVVAFVENAAVPHHNSGNRKLKNNNLILLDFGTKVDNYCSDMTRVFFFGKATDKQKKVYDHTCTAQDKAVEYIQGCLRTGKKPISTSVDSTARDFVVSLGYPPFNHSSHGIGLEVHENPHISSSKKPLQNGTVFSIEPGIYLPDKFGVRIEDLYTIQNNELIALTHSPKKLIEI